MGGAGRHEGAHLRQHGDERVLAQEGRLAAHVRAGDEADAPGLLAREVAGIGDEGLARLAQGRLHHRMAAALDREGEALVELRTGPIELDREFGVACRHVQRRERVGDVGDPIRLLHHPLAQPVEHLRFERQNPVGGARDLRFQLAQLDAGEAHGIDHGLAMHEFPHQALEAGLAHRLRHLDVVAEHVVVLDPQGPAAGGLGVARLQGRDDLPRVLAEQPGLVDLG